MSVAEASVAPSWRRRGDCRQVESLTARPARPDYHFLLGEYLDEAELLHARSRAKLCGVAVHRILIGEGRIDPVDYVTALAADLGLSYVGTPRKIGFSAGRRRDQSRQCWATHVIDGKSWVVFDGTAASPKTIAALAVRLTARGHVVGLAPPQGIRDCVLDSAQSAFLRHAVSGLGRADPNASARGGSWLWQSIALASGFGALLGLIVIAGLSAERLLTALVTLPFLAVVLVRIAVLYSYVLVPRAPMPRSAARQDDRDLPVYTLLVPLFREARVLPGLIAALRQLDYPLVKLDIKLILESVDKETVEAVQALRLLPPFDVIIVPDRQPRTKPKALNYALHFARGDYVSVYDAEDQPEPDQLRQALRVLQLGPKNIGCVQAKLVIDNLRAGWLCRQFAIEYLSQFEAGLPALAWLGFPMPLGGTSNHFPIRVLREVGGWDAWNMTEDADIGMRLARFGYRCEVIASSTYEEAPYQLKAWIKQRTRWLKGWMQTYLVHSRRPRRQLKQLGAWAWVGVHAQLGGGLLSSLIYPFCLCFIAWRAASGQTLLPAGNLIERTLVSLALFNLLAGYGLAFAQAAACCIGQRRWGLLLQLPLMPVYWLLISFAAYRALIQLGRQPFYWEKTEHGLTRRRRLRG